MGAQGGTTCPDQRKAGRRCLLLAGDLGDEAYARDCVARTVRELGRLDIVINNAAIQRPEEWAKVDRREVEEIFRSNVFSHFYVTSAAIPHLKRGARIINTTSVTAFRGHPKFLVYSATKGAMLAMMRTLNISLAEKGIRCNAIAPGPVWTPLIPASMPADHAPEFGESQPLGRPAQPAELAPAYVFLASTDSSYITGEVLHVNGGSSY
jgi:NAD(P)-dependent dehydrogenase (short-subunit alcohol dehydrogenase family)